MVCLLFQSAIYFILTRLQFSYNLVSLQIIKALIQTCHRDLNIFSKYVVNIFSMLLDTRDLEIIDLTCETVTYFGFTRLISYTNTYCPVYCVL
jgi:hypothetical protein